MISLATLPPDIIRKLIRLNPTESWQKLRLISPTWNDIVVEDLNARPSIRRVFMSANNDKIFLIRLEIDPNYADYFSKLFADVPAPTIEQTPDQTVLIFEASWTDYGSFLTLITRIIASTSNVETFQCSSFNANALRCVSKAMRNVQIERLQADHSWWDPFMRVAILKIIKRNKVYNVQMRAVKFVKQDISDAIQSFSPFVSIIGVDELNSDGGAFGNKTCKFWDSFANNLMDKTDLKMFRVLSGLRTPCRRFHSPGQDLYLYLCDPFFEFMHQFDAYFRC